MQSFKDLACILFVKVYSGQDTHVNEAVVFWYWPNGHGWQVLVEEL